MVTRSAPIWFVYERFEHLRILLERWGWEIVQHGDLSQWDEERRRDPVLGMVRIRGRRAWPLGGHVSFTIKEWWGNPPLEGPESRRGHVLAGYHYTGQSAQRQVRHCYDAIRHPDTPFHVHNYGDERIQPEPAITAEQALVRFEQRLAHELYEEAPVEFAEEDMSEAIFGKENEGSPSESR